MACWRTVGARLMKDSFNLCLEGDEALFLLCVHPEVPLFPLFPNLS